MNYATGIVIVIVLFVSGCTRAQTGLPRSQTISDSSHMAQSEVRGQSERTQVPVAVRLRDDSQLVGSLMQTVVSLKTAYGVVDLPLDKIRSIAVSDTNGTAVIEFANADILHGTINIASLPLQTSLGILTVPVQAIAHISVGKGASRMSEGLAAHYPFDGTAADESGHHHDGINHGAMPGIDRFGASGGAFEFNGAGVYVGLPNGLMDPAGDGFTWSLWALYRETANLRYLLYGGANTAESGLSLKDGNFSFGIKLEPQQDFSVTVAAPPSGRYIHIACVYRRGGSIQIWINGHMQGESAVPDGILMHGSSEHSAAIGSYAPEQVSHMRAFHMGTWLGSVDEVNLYNRPLSDSEIIALAADH